MEQFNEIVVGEESAEVFGKLFLIKNKCLEREASFSWKRGINSKLQTVAPSLGKITTVKYDNKIIYSGIAIISIASDGGEIKFDPEC